MPRYAPTMSVADLQSRLMNLAIENDYEEDYGPIDTVNPDYNRIIYTMKFKEILPKVIDDWNKINFDLENIDLAEFASTQDGVPYARLYCGGDWELPISTIVYYDGKTFRGYIPKNGNPYNHATNSAFGNDEDADEKAALKQFGSSVLDYADDGYAIKQDIGAIKTDIESRIKARGSATSDSTPVKSKAKIRAEEQVVIEAQLDLTGNFTPDMLYADISKAADGAYVEFKLKASNRSLTKQECERIVGIPANFHKSDSNDYILWYSPTGVYPAHARKMLEFAGFEIDPECYISEQQQMQTVVLFR
jgi:hypothetical protein